MNPKIEEVKFYLENNELFNKIKDLDKFSEVLYLTYPNRDILSELKKAYLWQYSNDKRQKKNQKRYITNWLSRAFSKNNLIYYKSVV